MANVRAFEEDRNVIYHEVGGFEPGRQPQKIDLHGLKSPPGAAILVTRGEKQTWTQRIASANRRACWNL